MKNCYPKTPPVPSRRSGCQLGGGGGGGGASVVTKSTLGLAGGRPRLTTNGYFRFPFVFVLGPGRHVKTSFQHKTDRQGTALN